MNKSVVVKGFGNANSMKIEQRNDIKESDIGPNDVLVQHKIIGLDFIDVCYRKGVYQEELPFIPGTGAVGVVEKCGKDVINFKAGDRVAYCTSKTGSYCQKRLIKDYYLVGVPDEISDKQAACITKGLVAHTLIKRAYIIRKNTTILVTAAAGGVGHILCQWASHMQCSVIGVVGSEDKKAFARKRGCKYVLTYDESDFVEQVMSWTKNEGVSAVYDSVGLSAYDNCFRSLGMFGAYVSYGSASGLIPAFDMLQVAEIRSLIVSRPSLYHYKAQRFELSIAALEFFEALKNGAVTLSVTKEYTIDDVVKAHKELEDRQITGAGIINVS